MDIVSSLCLEPIRRLNSSGSIGDTIIRADSEKKAVSATRSWLDNLCSEIEIGRYTNAPHF